MPHPAAAAGDASTVPRGGSPPRYLPPHRPKLESDNGRQKHGLCGECPQRQVYAATAAATASSTVKTVVRCPATCTWLTLAAATTAVAPARLYPGHRRRRPCTRTSWAPVTPSGQSAEEATAVSLVGPPPLLHDSPFGGAHPCCLRLVPLPLGKYHSGRQWAWGGGREDGPRREGGAPAAAGACPHGGGVRGAAVPPSGRSADRCCTPTATWMGRRPRAARPAQAPSRRSAIIDTITGPERGSRVRLGSLGGRAWGDATQPA